MTLHERLKLILEVDKDISEDILITVLKAVIQEYEEDHPKSLTEDDRAGLWYDDEVHES
jgi:hypothetical protein